ncbi:MMS19 nucleotide excision repair protein homolog [Galendromus occidentalis]|uniref:MMS19 nucleotide excision repair protein n=1 Tax=Galendromus occidentalis TaxID=34638 RepID=A0AAJ6QTQ5_9ACAR|nr:MMS19 nucleotide excision repair protein homolog [Galendromus occidentalis]
MVSDRGDIVEREAQRLVMAITSGATNLLAVIESMGSTLNSEEVVVRKEALETLGEVIRSIPSGSLNEGEVAPLLAYFTAQLKGHPDHSRAAIIALKALFEKQPVPKDAVGLFIERFFNDTALVDLTRDDKMKLYLIFHKILTDASFLEAAKKMHSAFLPGFLQLIEAETDPQCLMLCFSMYQIVVRNFPLGVYAEDMFEYPAAYFPIDFNAPPERHGGVTRGKLQEAVEECLLSHKSFEEHVIKLCLEKLTSQHPDAQIDSLRLLKRAVLKYDASIATEYSQAIWPTLRMLYMGHRGEPLYEEAIFRMVTALGQRLSEVPDWRGEVEKFSKTLWTDFEAVESFVEHSGWRFIVAFGGGSTRCATVILPKGFNKVTSLISDGQNINDSSIDAACALVHVVASLKDGFGDETLRKCVEMLASQGCALLLDQSRREHHVKLLGMLTMVLPLDTAIRDAEKESIKRFIENSILSSSSIPAHALKNFIAACSSHFGKSFGADLCKLGKECRCVWLLAGLVDKNGQNAEEICHELLSIRDSSALEAVQEILLNHLPLADTVFNELLTTFEEIPDDVTQHYQDLLAIATRSVPSSVISTQIDSLCGRLSIDSTSLLQFRVVLSNCPPAYLTASTCRILADKLSSIAKTSASSSLILSQCLALLANKHQEGSDASWLRELLESDCLSVSYIAKGLLMRNHELCENFMEVAFRNICDHNEGPVSFATIVKPEPKIFPREGGCTARILYTQRFMTWSMPRLLERFDTASETEKIALSSAICLALHEVSLEIAEKFTSKLRPVILWCLSQPSLPAEPSKGLLKCIRRNFPQLQLSIHAVIQPLLRWSQRPSPMELRIEAISGLHELKDHFETHQLLPHKKQVLKSLPIGDRKRLIRRAAACTSVTWHMLGEA